MPITGLRTPPPTDDAILAEVRELCRHMAIDSMLPECDALMLAADSRFTPDEILGRSE